MKNFGKLLAKFVKAKNVSSIARENNASLAQEHAAKDTRGTSEKLAMPKF